MKLGKKIFLIMALVAAVSVISFAGIAVAEFVHTKSQMTKMLQEEQERLYETNMEIMTDSQRENVASFAMAYEATLEERLDNIEDNLRMLGNYLKNLYENGVPEGSVYPDSQVLLQPGVQLEDVTEEFARIRSIRDLMNCTSSIGEDTTIYYVSESGMLLPDRMMQYGGSDVDRRERDWYIGAVEAGDIWWMEPYQDARTGEMTLTCSMPVFANGELKGVIAEDIYLSAISNLILEQEQNFFEDVFLLSSEGEYIAGINNTYAEDLQQAVSEMTAQHGEDNTAVSILNDKELILGGAKVKNTGWNVFVVLSYDTFAQTVFNVGTAIENSSRVSISFLDNNIRRVLVIFAVAAVALLFLVLMISLSFAKTLVKPIEQLTKGAGIISEGNLDYHLDIFATGEIKTLSDAFQKMTMDLKAYIENLGRVTAEKERIGAELHVATQIQADMLPRIFPPFPDKKEFDLYASMDPAKEVGGDFYDFFMVDDEHLALVIGDVSGKGVPAALFMVISKTIIKNYTMMGLTPDEVFTRTNADLCKGNEAGLFTTAWLGIYEISTGKLIFADAGHDTPMVRNRSGEIRYIKPVKKKLVLAAFDSTKYILSEAVLEEGDMLLLYTDGVSEATNLKEEQFGQIRLKQSLQSKLTDTPKDLLMRIHADVDEFVGDAPQFDDLTMLGLEIKRI